MKKTLSIVSKKQRYRVYPFLPPRPPILIRQQHQIKNHTKLGNSQSRRLKSPSSAIKTIIVVNRKNQEKIISYLRRFPFSQTRHLKHGSLITYSPEQISQSRHLHHFPDSAPCLSYICHLCHFLHSSLGVLFFFIWNIYSLFSSIVSLIVGGLF